MSDASVLSVATLAVGGTLLLAGWAKVAAYDPYFDGVAAYQLLPPRFVAFASRVVLLSEVIGGACLVMGVFPFAAAGVSSLAFVVFLIAQAANLARGRRIPCNCFGGSTSETISAFSLARTAALLFVSGVVMRFAEPTMVLRPRPRLAEVTIAAGLVVILRLFGYIPVAASYFRTPTSLGPVPSHRLSFRHLSIDSSLTGSPIPKGISDERAGNLLRENGGAL